MIRKVNEANDSQIRLLFASFDDGLRNLAGLLFTVSAEEFSKDLLVDALVPWWSRIHAERIGESLIELLANLDDETRKQRQATSYLSIDEIIQQGEQLLLSAPGIS